MVIPCYLNCRDRVTDLARLVGWLERAGQERIILLDNGSTYPPLLDYYSSTPHQVIFLGGNYGSRALWQCQLVPNEFYVYTDPDVVPLDECPLYAVGYLVELLKRHPLWPKAGLGLYLEDVPNLPSLAWERELTAESRLVEPGALGSLIDTTFAVYRPCQHFLYEGIRTQYPLMARHTSWYLEELDDENRYYLEHAQPGPLGSSWAAQRLESD